MTHSDTSRSATHLPPRSRAAESVTAALLHRAPCAATGWSVARTSPASGIVPAVQSVLHRSVVLGSALLRSALLRSALLLLSLSGCAPTAARRNALVPPPAGMQSVVMRSMDYVGRARLMETGEMNLFEALRRVRADLFRPRDAMGVSSDDALPAVYVNDVHQGDISALRGFATEVVRDVQLVRSIDTALRFGRAHPAGALIVRLQVR